MKMTPDKLRTPKPKAAPAPGTIWVEFYKRDGEWKPVPKRSITIADYLFSTSKEATLWRQMPLQKGKKTVPLLLLAALLAVRMSAWGQTPPEGLFKFDSTGNDLVAMCHIPKDNMTIDELEDQDTCIGFLHGALQGFAYGAIINSRGPKTSALPCVPTGVTNGQLIKVIVAYTDKHPAELHGDASVLVWLAVVGAWGFDSPEHPCQ
jgi:hypothetical protein